MSVRQVTWSCEEYLYYSSRHTKITKECKEAKQSRGVSRDVSEDIRKSAVKLLFYFPSASTKDHIDPQAFPSVPNGTHPSDGRDLT